MPVSGLEGRRGAPSTQQVLASACEMRSHRPGFPQFQAGDERGQNYNSNTMHALLQGGGSVLMQQTKNSAAKHALSIKGGENSACGFQVSWVGPERSPSPLWFQNLPSGPGAPGAGVLSRVSCRAHAGAPHSAHPALSKLYINPTLFSFRVVFYAKS